MKGTFLFLSSLLLFVSACDDQGDPVSIGPVPQITSVTPDSGKIGDTITVAGTNFGTTQGTSTISFGSTNSTTIISWSAAQIKAVIPSGVSGGTSSVTVKVSGQTSNAKLFKIIGTTATISFASDIKPMFDSYGCSGCHGSSGGLNVASVASLLTGGNHGPAIIVNNADGSILVKKLRTATLPFGSKMPANGGNVSDVDLQKIKDWINQGANN